MFGEEVSMETLLPFFDYCLAFAPPFVVDSIREHFEKNNGMIDPKTSVGIRLQLKHLYEELDKPLQLSFLDKFDHLVCCHYLNGGASLKKLIIYSFDRNYAWEDATTTPILGIPNDVI